MSVTKKLEPRKIHRNIPQLLVSAIRAAITVCVWGRATGKTTGPIADFTLHNCMSMPRSLNSLASYTYEGLLTNILPGIVKGWAQMGFEQDKHYFLRNRPPNSWRWPKAYRCPTKYDYYIPWYNGSGIILKSIDRSINNGIDVDSFCLDEARLCKEDMVREMILAVRGNSQYFGHLSNHLSIMICTDMPRSPQSKWILEMKDEMNEEEIKMILCLSKKINELKVRQHNVQENTARKMQSEINKYNFLLNELRRDTLYFSTANTLDNIHALGIKTIKNFKRTLSDYDFATSVLNQSNARIERGFYGLFDEEKHCYSMSNFSHIDNLDLDYRNELKKDSRWDADIQPYEPLDIACDYNAAINNMVIGQSFDDEYRILNHLWVEHPFRLKDLGARFCEYYAHHKHKEVVYYYDNTAIGTSAASDISFADEFSSILESKGWRVNRKYVGQASSHHSRYLLWGLTFREDDARLPRFRMNINNCKYLKISIEQAPVKKIGDKFKKDKSSERKEGIPAVEATHASEALDTLWFSAHRQRLNDRSSFSEAVFS